MINQRQIRNFSVQTLVEIKALTGRNGELCTCLDMSTTYKYVASGSAYTPDDYYYLTTGNGGDTRWVGISGTYAVISYTLLQDIGVLQADIDILDLKANKLLGDTLGFRFKVNVETVGGSGAGKFALPLRTTSVCSLTVHWGDGKSDVITVYNQTEATHTYAANGIYEIKILESATNVSFYTAAVLDGLKLVETINVPQTVLLTNGTGSPFRNCTNMTAFNSYAKIKLIGDCQMFFRACSNLTTIDLSIFDTTDVTSMSSFLRSCPKVTSVDIRSWNVAKMTTLTSLFNSCTLLASINMTGLNFAAVTNIGSAFFYTAITSIDLTPFANSLLAFIDYAFAGTKITSIDMSPIQVGPLISIESLLRSSLITSFTWTNKTFPLLTSIDDMLSTCSELISVDISGCSFPSLAGSYYLFVYDDVLETVDVSGCSFPVMDNMCYWFYDCPNLTSVDFTEITTGALEDVGSMFQYCTSLVTVDTSPIDFSTVRYFNAMFRYCTNLTSARIDVMDVRNALTGGGMTNFAAGVTFDTTEYSNALIYWATLPVQTGVICGVGNSKYNAGAVAARLYLTGTKGWVITDGGAE